MHAKYDKLLEFGKEALRVMVLAAIPIVIDGITQGKINWTLVIGSAVIAGLRALEKVLHETDRVSLPF